MSRQRAILIGAVIAAVIISANGTASATNNKVTICHNGHTITISESALDGHFDHEGQPAVGHENDYMGPCIVDTSTTTVPPTTVPTTVPPVDPVDPVDPPQIDTPLVLENKAVAPVPVVVAPEFTG